MGHSRLQDGACSSCLKDPLRGRAWVEMAHRCCTEPSYALKVYSLIKTDSGREKFAAVFGVPAGAPAAAQPPTPKLRLVR